MTSRDDPAFTRPGELERAVLEAIAEETDTPLEDVERPDAIDLEALDELFVSSESTALSARFTYQTFEVRVDQQDGVTIH